MLTITSYFTPETAIIYTKSSWRIYTDGSWKPDPSPIPDDYFSEPGTHQGGGCIVVTQDTADWIHTPGAGCNAASRVLLVSAVVSWQILVPTRAGGPRPLWMTAYPLKFPRGVGEASDTGADQGRSLAPQVSVVRR